jgi:hypothetical protein
MGIQNAKEIPLIILANKGVMINNNLSYEKLSNLILRENPTLVTIDSLIRVHNKDENSANEMNDVLRRIKALIANRDSSVILTHHTNKTYNSGRPSSNLRGSGDIRNFVDSCVFMSSVGGSTEYKTLTHDKSRWDIPIPKFMIKLQDVDDGSATVLSYASSSPLVNSTPVVVVPAAKTKADEAKELIIKLLKEKGTLSRKNILYQARKVALIGQVTVDKTLRKLVEDGKISSQGGVGTEKKFRLKGK